MTIQLPPVRERTDDIPELAHYFLFRFNRDLGTNVNSIAEETLERLQHYSWPGNIRELQSVIRETLVRSAGPVLLPEFLPEQLGSVAADALRELPVPNGELTWNSLADDAHSEFNQGVPGVYRRVLEKFDRLIVTDAMARTNGNQAAAAELLGLSRPTLRAKLRSFASRATPPNAQSSDGT